MINEQIPAVMVILNDVLKRYRVKSITKQTIEVLISVYPDLDTIERRKLRQSLVLLGYEGAAEILENSDEGSREEASFVCPILKASIVSSCRMGTCRYHIRKESEYNCLLIASGRGEMTPSQVANIYEYEPTQVENIRIRAFRKMRESAVDVAQEKSELRPEFTFLHNPRVCGVCEKAIEGRIYYQEEGVSICSGHCLDQRNPAEVVLESRYGIPAQKLIDWVNRNFENVDIAAQSLGFPTSVLTRALTATS